MIFSSFRRRPRRRRAAVMLHQQNKRCDGDHGMLVFANRSLSRAEMDPDRLAKRKFSAMLIRLVARLMRLAIVPDDEQGDKGCRVGMPLRHGCHATAGVTGTMTAWPFDLLGRAERSSPKPHPAPIFDVCVM